MLSRVMSGWVRTEDATVSERVKVLEEQVRVAEEARKRAENQARKL